MNQSGPARYKDQEGIITNVNSETTEARINTIFNVSPSINITSDLNFRRSDNMESHNMTEIFRLMIQNAIWTVPKYPDGTYGGGEQGNNPLLMAEAGGLNQMDTNYIIGNIKGDWEITDGLLFSTQYAIDSDVFYRKDFVNTWETRDGSTVKKRNQTNRLNEFRNQSRRYTFENTLIYSLDLGNSHSFDLLGGYSQIEQESSNLYAYRQDFYNNEVQALIQGADDTSKNNSGRDTKWALRSVFGRFNYSFQDKYLFEVNSRYDGSSRFTGDNQYSFFPSFSVGWRLSQEEFWSGAGFDQYANEFKLRGSWGETGKETVALYSYLPTMHLVSYTFNGNPVEGVIQQEQANQDLTWEKTTQLNVGLDAEFLSNRLSVTVDYYEKITDGILLTLPVPATFGLGGGPQNAGKVENKGWEFAVGMRNNVGELSYRANLNFNINENKVLSLAETGPFILGSDIDPRYITGEGYAINSFWGYKTDGLFQSDEEAQNYPEFQRPARAGDVKILDLNNDGVINPDDMTYRGNSYPTYTYGANFNFNYKGLGLNVLFQGAADVSMRYSRALAEAGNYEGFTPDIYTGNYWTPENTDARFSRPTKRNVRNQASSDRMLIDASYLRIKNLQLSYQLPTDLTSKISLSQMSVYLSGTNLLTFSDLNEWNLDPESSTGWQNYYPQTSVYTLGVRFQL
jgi:TonB-linked SusC/RagA family outer membrane protein